MPYSSEYYRKYRRDLAHKKCDCGRQAVDTKASRPICAVCLEIESQEWFKHHMGKTTSGSAEPKFGEPEPYKLHLPLKP